tara:strand:+ start:840 stop:1079 length:240 start_codon:yes stop_codon:yes gene_type:complete
MNEKFKQLLTHVTDEDWVLVITPDGQLKTVLLPKNKDSMTYTIKQAMAIAESGMEEMFAQEFQEEFPNLAEKLNKKTIH